MNETEEVETEKETLLNELFELKHNAANFRMELIKKAVVSRLKYTASIGNNNLRISLSTVCIDKYTIYPSTEECNTVCEWLVNEGIKAQMNGTYLSLNW
jgi:hypothetical protein